MKCALILGLIVLVAVLSQHESTAVGLDSPLSDKDLQTLMRAYLDEVQENRVNEEGKGWGRRRLS